MTEATASRMSDELLFVTARAVRRERAIIDVVIPVHNEAAILADSVCRAHTYLTDRFPLPWIITIADNASTDDTWAIACGVTNELDGVQALHLGQKGRGLALRAAWSESPAPVVAYMDVDLSTDLDALLPLVAPLVSGHSDVAIGTRLAAGARVVRGPRREVISRAYNLLAKLALGSTFSDAQCGFKALRAEVARALLPAIQDDGWFFDTELLVLAERNGLRIHEVPVDWVDDAHSSVDLVKTAREDLRGVGRLMKRIINGDGHIPLSRADELEPSITGQLVRFASIGAVSTVVFAALFWLLASPLGSIGADIVALLVCSMINTEANRRLTFSFQGRANRARHLVAGLVVTLLPLAMNVGVLLGLRGLGVTPVGFLLAALTGVNLIASLARFLLLRNWVFKSAARTCDDDLKASARP